MGSGNPSANSAISWHAASLKSFPGKGFNYYPEVGLVCHVASTADFNPPLHIINLHNRDCAESLVAAESIGPAQTRIGAGHRPI